MRTLLRGMVPGFRLMLLFTVGTGLLYPGLVTGLCQLFWPRQANGELVRAGGRVAGSELIGQGFTRPEYFHGRPSEAGTGYDAANSGPSNLGPTSARLVLGATRQDGGTGVEEFDGVSLRLVHYCLENGIAYASSAPLGKFRKADGALDEVKLIEAFNAAPHALKFRALVPIPADAVTGSGSGLDPDISPANAQLQAGRVARARDVAPEALERLIAVATKGPTFGVLGEARVNVLELNLALDKAFPLHGSKGEGAQIRHP